MKKNIIFSIIIAFNSLFAFAQQLPANTCGIVNTYDASGNRLRRLYFCNFGIDPYPLRPNKTKAKVLVDNQTNSQPDSVLQPKVSWEFQSVDALYPNPTTGMFSITFSRPLNNAVIIITDVDGKIISRFTARGYKIDCNLSSLAAGTYFIKIQDGSNSISKKVIKQ